MLLSPAPVAYAATYEADRFDDAAAATARTAAANDPPDHRWNRRGYYHQKLGNSDLSTTSRYIEILSATKPKPAATYQFDLERSPKRLLE